MGLITSLFTVGAAASARAWCRPGHRTNCFAVTGGNSCCVCIPSTATCFVIEMWGQGGGGSGSCCCMGACWGGQAGDYGWVRCTTSGTNHILCACACNCTCCTPGAGLYTGSPGQETRTCNCTTGILYRMAPQACGGSTCCFGVQPMNSPGCTSLEYNTWHSNIAINCCWYGNSVNNWCTDGTSYEGPGNGCRDWWGQVRMPFRQIQGTAATGETCTCCQQFNFYVRGGCGWTSPWTWTTYSGPGNQNCGFNQPTVSFCGNGFGRGGTAYAGGAGQCCDCQSQNAPQFGGVNGNFPGGGGSSASGTGCTGGCCLGSCGGPGLVLISWS